jgi:hypothetical protein|tara:strand:- start:293 stop:871 length:579 start_codon:yes stop_codon:yes gene_type:complete
MSDLSDLHEHENKPRNKNPFKGRPIPKSRIQWAIQSTLSIRAASQYLGVAYNTFKKYAIMYDIFEQNKNQAGVGVTTKGNTGWGVKIQDLFDGKHPNYPHWKLQERIIRDGYLKQCCSNCDYDDYREKDMRGPYIINFLDGDSTNHSQDNLALLCYNCFFIMKPTGKLLNTPKNTNLIKKKLQEVWEENDSE